MQSKQSVPEHIIYPCIVIDTKNDCLLDQASTVSVLIDNQVLTDCTDIFAAVVVLFACYYVFDIQYPSSLENTMIFLDSHVVATEKRRITTSIQRKINMLV